MDNNISNPALVAFQQNGAAAQWVTNAPVYGAPQAPVTVTVTTTASVVDIPIGSTVTASGAISAGVTAATGTAIAAGTFTWHDAVLTSDSKLYVAAASGTVSLTYTPGE